MPDCKDFFSYNTCSGKISGVCRFVGLTVKISKQDFIYLIWEETLIFAGKKNVHIYVAKLINLSFYLAVKFINSITSYISAGHFTDPVPFGNVLEDSLPITSWISKHFFN